MLSWTDSRCAHYARLAALPAGTTISSIGCDPGDQASRKHSAALALVSATVTGAEIWKRGQIRTTPALADVKVEWAAGIPWRSGEAARFVLQNAGEREDLSAVIVEDQYWPFTTRAADARDDNGYGGGGRFKSLAGLAACSGVIAGAAHIAQVPCFSAKASSWIPLLGAKGRTGKKSKPYRSASVALMRDLGGPKRGTKYAAGHDLGAAVCLALLGLGCLRTPDPQKS